MSYLQLLFVLAVWFWPNAVVALEFAAPGVRQKEDSIPIKEPEPEETVVDVVQPREVTTHEYNYVGEPNSQAWPDEGLGECEADCDNDKQCRKGLTCFDRRRDEDVPGCTGVAERGKDYCYNATTLMPTMSPAPSESPTSSPAPTGTPAPTLRPTTAPPTASPTITFQPTSSPAPTESPTSSPTRTTLAYLDRSQVPFRKCEGNCKRDSDCAGNLRCQKRGGNEWVPGCTGEGTRESRSVNYCYDMADGAAPPMMPKPGFRLKLYWEREYYWQETYVEAKWCLEDEDPPQVEKCRDSSTKFEFVYLPGQGDQIKVVGKDRCLDRTSRRNITYQPCDEDDINQRWLGNWASRRFDIRNAGAGTCFTQHHHPKSGEIVSLWNCMTAHFTSTGYWNLY